MQTAISLGIHGTIQKDFFFRILAFWSFTVLMFLKNLYTSQSPFSHISPLYWAPDLLKTPYTPVTVSMHTLDPSPPLRTGTPVFSAVPFRVSRHSSHASSSSLPWLTLSAYSLLFSLSLPLACTFMDLLL